MALYEDGFLWMRLSFPTGFCSGCPGCETAPDFKEPEIRCCLDMAECLPSGSEKPKKHRKDFSYVIRVIQYNFSDGYYFREQENFSKSKKFHADAYVVWAAESSAKEPSCGICSGQ